MGIFKFLGNDVGGNAYLRDPRHAARNFSFTDSVWVENSPRQKFQFFCTINFSQQSGPRQHIRKFFDNEDQKYITNLVKSLTLPSIDIETETLNQYNKKKVIQTRIQYKPITMTFYDAVDGKILRLWEAYYEYYFRDGLTFEKLKGKGRKLNDKEFIDDVINTEQYNDKFGYNVTNTIDGLQKYLIDSIDIYQVHGSRLSKTTIVHPRISNFNPGDLNFSDSGICETTFTFEYEAVVYQNNYDVLNGDLLDYFRHSDHVELKKLIKIPIPVRQRQIMDEEGKYPSEDIANAFDTLGNLLSGGDPSAILRDIVRDTGIVTDIQGSLNTAIGNVQGSIVQGLSNRSFTSSISSSGSEGPGG